MGKDYRVFDTVEGLGNAKDGEVSFTGKKLFNTDFDRESDLEAYICANIEWFCDALGEKYISHETNKPIVKRLRMSPQVRRVDMYIKCRGSVLIVELKNQPSGTQSRAAIGQVLDYGRVFIDTRKKQMVIVTTKFDQPTAKTIKHYNLPIRYIYMSKRQKMEFLK